MQTKLKEIVERLVEIKDDVDAIYHHQTERIVRELDEVIHELRHLAPTRFESA